jgi:hypothetical protein
LRITSALHDLADLHVLHGDAPFKGDRKQGVEHQVEQVVALPTVVAGDPKHAEADISVHAENVGVLVVQEIVVVPPVLG